VVVLPPLFAAVFLGARAIESAWPQWRRGWSSFFTLALLGLIVMSLPELNPNVRDQVWPTPILHRFNTTSRRSSWCAIRAATTPGHRSRSTTPTSPGPRAVYRFDKSDLSITHLGQVADLARQVAPSPH
jgi:hypothetical protein